MSREFTATIVMGLAVLGFLWKIQGDIANLSERMAVLETRVDYIE